MIHITDKSKCSGCAACAQICPKSAISMVVDDEGFLYPQVNYSLCVDCDVCRKKCPFEKPYDVITPIRVVAYKHPDLKLRMSSSSGGAFSALATYVVNQGGVVFGARFDNNWQVAVSFTETLEGIAPFRQSKYVQATIGHSFENCRAALKANRMVLFSGTPCQIAGLNHFLGRQYDNLYTAEVICHGTSSPAVWESYLKTFSSDLSRIKNVNLRYKGTNGGYRYLIVTDSETYNITARQSPYHNAFIQNYSVRPSCFKCEAKNGKSHADFTMGDCWGIETIAPEFDDKRGVSSICFNTDKAMALLNKVFADYIDIPLSIVKQYNQSYSKSAKKPYSRRFFWSQFQKQGIKAVGTTIKRDKKTIYRIIRKILQYI